MTARVSARLEQHAEHLLACLAFASHVRQATACELRALLRIHLHHCRLAVGEKPLDCRRVTARGERAQQRLCLRGRALPLPALEDELHHLVILAVACLGEREAEQLQVERHFVAMAPVDEHRDDVRARMARSHFEHASRLLVARADVSEHLGHHALDGGEPPLFLNHALEEQQRMLRRRYPRLQQQAEQLVPPVKSHRHERFIPRHRYCEQRDGGLSAPCQRGRRWRRRHRWQRRKAGDGSLRRAGRGDGADGEACWVAGQIGTREEGGAARTR